MMNHITSTHPNLFNSKLDNNVVIEELKNKRGPKKYSWVWTYLVSTSSSRAFCRLCDKPICHSGGNLARHLRKVHDIDEDDADMVKKDVPPEDGLKCDNLKTENGVKTSENKKEHTYASAEDSKRRSLRWLWEYFEKLTDTTFRCKQCKASVKYATNRLRHMQRNHSDIYTSKTGEKVVKKEKKTRSSLRKRKSRRWVWEHFDKLSDTRLRCKLCKESIKYASNMFRHMQRNHTDIYNTKVDEKIVKKEKKTPTSRKRGRPRQSWVWRYYACNVSHAACKLCKKVLQLQKDSSTGNLIKHLMKLHNEVINKEWIWLVFEKDDDDDKYSCRICSFKCDKTDDLYKDIVVTIYNHLKTEHGLESGDQVRTESDDVNLKIEKEKEDESDKETKEETEDDSEC